jgi:hypothetical protein
VKLRWLLVALGGLLALPASANPPLANSSFEIIGPNGSPTVHSPPAPGGAGVSAADSWGVFHNTAGGPNTTVTEIVPTTLPVAGAGARMIHVTTDGALNGITQVTGAPGTGPPSCTVSGWVLALSGTVGMGGGNHGNTQPTSITTTTTGVWEYLQVENLDSPCNTIIFYSIDAGADYYVDAAGLLEHQAAEIVPPLEYSNDLDEKAIAAGGNHNGLDPGQILYSEPPDTPADANPQDVVDFFPAIESGNEPDAQVDALAHGADGFFDEVRDDEERLIISIDADPGVAQQVAAYFEDPDGSTGVQYTHRDLNDPNFIGDLDDVDALELWRTLQDVNLDDSNYFSLVGDVGGGSVWNYIGGVPVVYITPAEILSAIAPLGFEGEEGDVDVDALMVKDTGVVGTWDYGDEILFSVRSAGGWTGGEIVHWEWSLPAAFLIHGGHAWDSSFSLATAFPVDENDQEVDAIEAVPEPGVVVSLLSGVVLLGALSRLRRGSKTS